LSMLVFVIARVLPGDPARLALGPLATSEQIQKYRHEMNLDRPFFSQYFHWLKAAFRGDFGKSSMTGRSVSDDIVRFLPATLELGLFTRLISVVVGQLLGVFAGRYKNSWFDNLSRLISYAGIVTPAFVAAIVLFLLSHTLGFGVSLGRLSLGVSPPTRITGFYVLDGLFTGRLDIVIDALRHLILPALSLSLLAVAQEARITRSSFSDNMKTEFAMMHEVYGFPNRLITFKYVLKPSLLPTVAVMGLSFANVLSIAFLVELVYAWPGFSRYGIDALLSKDLNAIIAVVMVLGVAFVLANVVVDIVVLYLDPRIRFFGRERG